MLHVLPAESLHKRIRTVREDLRMFLARDTATYASLWSMKSRTREPLRFELDEDLFDRRALERKPCNCAPVIEKVLFLTQVEPDAPDHLVEVQNSVPIFIHALQRAGLPICDSLGFPRRGELDALTFSKRARSVRKPGCPKHAPGHTFSVCPPADGEQITVAVYGDDCQLVAFLDSKCLVILVELDHIFDPMRTRAVVRGVSPASELTTWLSSQEPCEQPRKLSARRICRTTQNS